MDKEDIKLTDKEGAIVIREDASPEIYTPIGVGDHCDSVRFTLAFLLYAVEKDDWVEEFSTFVESVQTEHKRVDADDRRLKFKIIDGDKT